MPSSPAQSLFASDYSLSGPASPASPRLSPRPSPSRPTIPSPLRAKPINVNFPTSDELTVNTSLPTPPSSPGALAVDRRSPDQDIFAPEPHRISRNRSFALPEFDERRESSASKRSTGTTGTEMSRMFSEASTRKSSHGYAGYEECMEGGLGHETKANTYKTGTEKAYHHLNRALDCFSGALTFKASSAKAMLAKSKVLIQLATNYQPARTSLGSLQEAVKILRQLSKLAPQSVSVRETLAQACALLSCTLMDQDDGADDESTIWEGQVGTLAREALSNLEEVAADKMDRMREMKQDDAAEQAPGLAEIFLALSSAAITVSTLATRLSTVDMYMELAEQALDQASNMATVAASARVRSSTSSANLITRVQLASGASSLERLRHCFLLGTDLDEDDFRSLMADMSMLADECRERSAKLKGSKATAASTLAYEAVKQLGDAKLMYASLLRLVWRRRRPAARKTSGDNGERKSSGRSDNVEATIKEDEEEEGKLVSISTDKKVVDVFSTLSVLSKDDPKKPSDNVDHRKDSVKPSSPRGSALGKMPEDEEVQLFSPVESRFNIIPARRGSWLAGGPDATPAPRSRRLSSMSSPLIGPDGISAWSRKASVISLTHEDEAAGIVTSAELAGSAWQLLEAATKQYKLALTLLSASDLPTAQLARGKSETLNNIAYASLFMASLAARVAIANEKRRSLLLTCEVYATWAAREVGWSFLIEGTKEAALADRRTNSWRADEAGKRAVMLLVRCWWHRAVTTESMDVETKCNAKDAVEVVVRRMKDREGVRDGDVVRFKCWMTRMEGELDGAETLFWRSVSRILRGGAGFVMS